MGRTKGSKNKNNKTVESSLLKRIQVSKPKPQRVRKQNFLVEDSASEDEKSYLSSTKECNSAGSNDNFIDDSDVYTDQQCLSTQEQYVDQCLRAESKRDGRSHYAKADKCIGHDSYPVNDFSLTVSKLKGDVCRDAIVCVHNFIKDCCIKGIIFIANSKLMMYNSNKTYIGAVSTEVGKRAFNLHLQCVVKLHYPKTKEYVALLTKGIKITLPGNGIGYRVLVKPFGPSQTFSSMIGYCTKDNGRSHYRLLLHNIDPNVSVQYYMLQYYLNDVTAFYRKCLPDDKIMTRI